MPAWLRPCYAQRVFWWTSGLLGAGLVTGHALAAPAALPIGSQLWVTLPLVYGSMVIHEFGHVAATARAGVKHGGIGFGMYAYLFPVLYADVTGPGPLLPPAQLELLQAQAAMYDDIFDNDEDDNV